MFKKTRKNILHLFPAAATQFTENRDSAFKSLYLSNHIHGKRFDLFPVFCNYFTFISAKRVECVNGVGKNERITTCFISKRFSFRWHSNRTRHSHSHGSKHACTPYSIKIDTIRSDGYVHSIELTLHTNALAYWSNNTATSPEEKRDTKNQIYFLTMRNSILQMIWMAE